MTDRTKIIVIAAVIAVCVLVIVGVLSGAAVIGWRSAVRAGNEAATLQNMKTIAVVELQYFTAHNKTFATIDRLVAEKMLSSKFAGSPPFADGYVLTLKLTGKKENPGSSYTLNADPLNDEYGKSHFYLDSSSASIYVNPDTEAGPSDPLV